ncbi:MAG: hypothetical protein E6K63_00400 [Nitrospirae bacterium]|nr:MAG: hypothetical protein E6K63_00400 [Nitrospirota bacterium]
MSFLPSADLKYLTTKGVRYEELVVGDQKAVIFMAWELEPGRFDHPLVDILVLLPSGYPDTGPDMFHTLPWLRLASVSRYPRAADQSTNFNGQSWQRWSRHNSDWRPGRDGIWTVVKRIEHAFEVAQA